MIPKAVGLVRLRLVFASLQRLKPPYQQKMPIEEEADEFVKLENEKRPDSPGVLLLTASGFFFYT